MDAVEFFKTVKRLCLCKDQDCKECPAVFEDGMCMVMLLSMHCDDLIKSTEEMVSKVEQWAKDYPVKTRQSEFLKMFPNANLKNITRLLPCSIDSSMNPLRCAKYGYVSITCRCDRCRDDYWNEEVDN
nr:MAG TPA: hypothetical protein [Caudoviricetes sp.]